MCLEPSFLRKRCASRQLRPSSERTVWRKRTLRQASSWTRYVIWPSFVLRHVGFVYSATFPGSSSRIDGFCAPSQGFVPSVEFDNESWCRAPEGLASRTFTYDKVHPLSLTLLLSCDRIVFSCRLRWLWLVLLCECRLFSMQWSLAEADVFCVEALDTDDMRL